MARSACITALSNPSHGIVVLPTVIQLSGNLATLAMMLDSRPDLLRKLRKTADADAGEGGKTLVEGTAESIQRAFTVCLTERSSSRNGIGRDGQPEGKKIGIYSLANKVLKLLFQVRSTEHSAHIGQPDESTVSKDQAGQPAFHQHHTEFSTTRALSCK